MHAHAFILFVVHFVSLCLQCSHFTQRLSMGIRQPLSFSLSDLFGGNLWASALFYDSKSGDPLVFASDVATYLVAPYTGVLYCVVFVFCIVY